MSGERPTSPVVRGSNDRRPLGTLALVAGVAAVVALVLLAGGAGSGVAGKGHIALFRGGVERAVLPAYPPITINYVKSNISIVDVTVSFNLTVNATGGSNVGTNYNYTWINLPPGCVNSWLNYDNCASTTAGSYPVTVTVKDTVALVQATSNPLVITVNPLPAVSAFTVQSASSVKVSVNSTIWFNATGTLGTGPYTYKYTGLPIGCAGNTSSFSCAPTRAGLYNVTVSAIDSFGLASVVKNVTVTVTPVKKSTAATGIGTTGWAIVIGILVIGALVTVALLLQARREERAGRMGMQETPEGPSGGSGGKPPTGGGMPPGPSS
ncbi:MAG: hypothetical protein L3J97_02840 [Thermoplasmata archaeon]|nr:hypothetical protein [Thermoplasmata archaeon]